MSSGGGDELTAFLVQRLADVEGYSNSTAAGVSMTAGTSGRGTSVNIGSAPARRYPCFDAVLIGDPDDFGSFMVDVLQDTRIVVPSIPFAIYSGSAAERMSTRIHCPFPLYPQQIKAQAECNRTAAITCYVIPYQDHPNRLWKLGRCTAYGAGANLGTQVDATVAGEGSWTTLDASTANRIRALTVIATGIEPTQYHCAGTLDLAWDDGGNKREILSRIPMHYHLSDVVRVEGPYFGLNVPAGVDLQARINASETSRANVTVLAFD